MTLLYRHQSSYEHETGEHPENAGRIRAIDAALAAHPPAGIVEVEAPLADIEAVERAHDAEHVAAVAAFCASGGGMIDADTIACERSWDAALRAAGAACDAVERMLAGEGDGAFCSLRPPGHHAERARSMGFCLLNQAAIAAEHARSLGIERVLILDWDVHHGNGTEEIFKSEPAVLYASIHQSPLYPGTGGAGYEGEGEGTGLTVNMPVPSGTGSAEFISLVDRVAVPLVREFDPGLVIVSAGFDAHRDDPLATCEVETEAYGEMASSMSQAAADVGAPLLVCLEGGYDPDALAASVLSTLAGMESPGEGDGGDEAFAAPYLSRLASRWRFAA